LMYSYQSSSTFIPPITSFTSLHNLLIQDTAIIMIYTLSLHDALPISYSFNPFGWSFKQTLKWQVHSVKHIFHLFTFTFFAFTATRKLFHHFLHLIKLLH